MFKNKGLYFRIQIIEEEKKMNNEFGGVYVALLTPFDEKNNIDEKKMRNHIDFLISKGINGLYICGSTGEGILMDVNERKMVAEIVKDQVKEKVKIIAHVGGSTNTKNAIELARHAEKMKLDGISSIPPFYYSYSFGEIYNYYKDLSKSTDLPFFVYYIPATTGVSLLNEQMAKLCTIPNIVGLKYTASDLYFLQDLLRKVSSKWIAFSGYDEMFLPALTMGVVGCIGSTQNVLPEIFVQIYNNFTQGNIKKAMELQKRLNIAISILHKYGYLVSCKTALQFRGLDVGYCRPPFKKELSQEDERKLLDEWKKYFSF